MAEALPNQGPLAEASVPNTADDSAQALRKRARRACLYCRARKVRCNVSLDGLPCTNCRLDARDCVVKPRARKWPCSQPPVQVFQHKKQPLPQFQDGDVDLPDDSVGEPYHPPSLADASHTTSHLNASLPLAVDYHSSEVDSLPNSRLGQPSDRETNQVDNDDAFCEYRNHDTSVDDRGQINTDTCFDQNTFSTELAPMRLCDRREEPFVLFSCYPFIEADTLGRLSSSDVSFLQQRGCFYLPARSALEEFVREYFSHMHPILPVINEADFWKITSSQLAPSSDQRRLSLFLLQSILFVSCPFVSQSTLLTLGFASVQRARTELYSRAKALFDIDTHRDDITSAQGALLLTYHAPTANNRINTYWLSTAVHFARSARADQYSTIEDATVDKSALKRLWWCCVLRDRIMALGLRRPMCIRPLDFDFTLPGFTENDFADEIRYSRVYNPATKRILIQLAVSLGELGVVLNDVLEVIYPMKPSSHLGYCQRSYDKLLMSLASLDGWYEKTVAKFLTPTHVSGAHRSVILFTDMVYMYYFTAKASICNHMMLLSITGPEVDDNQRHNRLQTRAQLVESLHNITDILKELQQLGLSKYLPNTFIAFSAFPFLWRMLDAKVISSDYRSDVVKKDLETYTEVMNGFRNMYESTDSVLQSIEKIVDYIKLNEPLQRLQSDAPSLDRKPTSSMLPPRGTQVRSNDAWAKLLDENPYSYMRISLTVEYSLSRGQFPSEKDFPKALQTLHRNHNYFTSYNALTELDDSVFYDLLEQALEAGQGA